MPTDYRMDRGVNENVDAIRKMFYFDSVNKMVPKVEPRHKDKTVRNIYCTNSHSQVIPGFLNHMWFRKRQMQASDHNLWNYAGAKD